MASCASTTYSEKSPELRVAREKHLLVMRGDRYVYVLNESPTLLHYLDSDFKDHMILRAFENRFYVGEGGSVLAYLELEIPNETPESVRERAVQSGFAPDKQGQIRKTLQVRGQRVPLNQFKEETTPISLHRIETITIQDSQQSTMLARITIVPIAAAFAIGVIVAYPWTLLLLAAAHLSGANFRP